MSNRCPSCSKMASLETQVEDPDLEYDPEDGTVSGTVRVVRTSACCSDEMTENNFDVELDVGVAEDHKDGDEYAVEIDASEPTESGGGRYQKNMIGFEIEGRVVRTREGKESELFKFDVADNAPASSYDDLN